MRVLLWVVWLALPVQAGITVRQGEVRAGADFEPAQIKYAEQLQLTLWVEGPAPLEVTSPKPVLVNPNTWRVYEPSLPLREVLPDGRQRWQQTYRLSPLAHKKVVISPSPLKVRAGPQAEITLEWDAAGLLVADVISSIDNPSVDALRPAADIEQLPPPPPLAATTDRYRFAIVPFCLVVAYVLLRCARRPRTVPSITTDATWARHQLLGDTSPEHCARVLRAYVGYRLGHSVQAQTTTELIRQLGDGPFTPPQIAVLHDVLTQCDQARFSGQPDTTSCSTIALQWLDEVAASMDLAVEVRGSPQGGGHGAAQ